MPTIRELNNNPEFDALSMPAKTIAFGKISTGDEDYLKLSQEAQAVVKQRLLGVEAPERVFGSAVEGGPVESDVFPSVLREHPTLAGAVGVGAGFAELAGNIPASTFELGKDILLGLKAIVTDPVEVAKGFGAIASGAIEKALPGFQGGSKKDIEAFNAVADAIKGRYGSLENFSESAIQNPAGVAQDLSIIVGGLGLVTKTPLALKTATILDPVSTIVAGTGRAAKASTPVNRLIKASVKFDKKKGLASVDELANAFVQKGLNVNRKSLAKLDADMTETIDKINQMVTKSAKEGETILTRDIVKSLDKLILNAGREGLELPDIRVINRMKNDFLELHGEVITTVEAQALKRGFNKAFKPDLVDKFGQVRGKVRDTLRDTVKVHLEDIHPGLKELNVDWKVSKDLHKAIEKRVLALEEAKIVSVEGLAAGGIAGGIAGTTRGFGAGLKFGAAAVAVDKIIESPRIQILVNRAINKINEKAAKAGKFIPPSTKTLSQIGRVEREKPIQ